jgi:hypothetical protein
MEKGTKILIGVGLFVLVAGVGAYAYNNSKKNSKPKKSDNKKPDVKGTTTTTTTTIDKKSTDNISSKPELATVNEAREIIAKAINTAKKTGNDSWLSRLAGTDVTKRNKFYKNFKDNGVTIAEYNATAKFLDTYEKSESNTLSKMSKEENDLMKSFTKKTRGLEGELL